MDSRTYECYVKIDCWQMRRQRYISKHGWCEVCGVSPRESDELYEGIILDVHHLNYDHLGNERDEELVSVCRMCHAMFHDLTLARYRQLALATLRSANELLGLPKRTKMIEILESK
jgi:hypothetical protein